MEQSHSSHRRAICQFAVNSLVVVVSYSCAICHTFHEIVTLSPAFTFFTSSGVSNKRCAASSAQRGNRTRKLLSRIVVYNPVHYHEQCSAPPSFFLFFPAQRRRPRHAAPCNRSAPRCCATRLQNRNIIVCCKLLLLLLLLLLLPNCTLSSPSHALLVLQRARARL